MSKQDPSEQVKFLVSCIGHTTNGRPDFGAVAEELNIVSKAAAQKRYERMLKANGVSGTRPAPKASADDDKTPQSTPRKRKPARPGPGSATKKTKAMKSEDSDDDMKHVKPEPKVKAPKKEEDEDDSALSDPPESDETDESK